MPPLTWLFTARKSVFLGWFGSHLAISSVLLLESRVGFYADELTAILGTLDFLENGRMILVVLDFWIFPIFNSIAL